VIVFNAEECQTDEEFRTTDIVDIRIHTTKE
jgi:hypothetical protein